MNVAGSLNVAGTLTASNLPVAGGNQTINQLTLVNPAIAVAAGGNILDYGYFSTSAAQAIGTGGVLTFSSPAVNSAGIILDGTNQTITFVNSGIYLFNLYVNGSSSAASSGFELAFINPGGGNNFSGGVTTIGAITTISGTAIVACTAGRTMQLVNQSTGTFTLSNGGIAGSSTAGLSIIRLQ